MTCAPLVSSLPALCPVAEERYGGAGVVAGACWQSGRSVSRRLFEAEESPSGCSTGCGRASAPGWDADFGRS